jgi:hypothetical protein
LVKDASGNVGIGTSSPTSLGANFKTLELQAGSSSAGGGYYLTGNGTAQAQVGVDTLTGYIGMRSNHPVVFTTNNTERARIDSSGNLLVGGTTQPIGTCRLVVQNSGASSNGAGFFFTSTDDRGNVLIQHAGATGATSRKQISFFNASGSEVGYVSSTGSATSYVTSSDYRLKENIAPMTDALSVVQQLKPVTYTWKDGGFSSQGFIAHELQKIVPECVVGEKDSVDAEGNPKYQGIDTSFLVATLTAAIQELKALVDTQASTITTMTDRITALEAK